jgi:MoxR-like ATPase
MVVATQNPIDMEGTYALPEAQMDRFSMKVSVGYPSAEAEVLVIGQERNGASVEELKPVLSVPEVVAMIAYVKQVKSTPQVDRYIVDLCNSTRSNSASRLGASPRGSLALLRTARACAAIDGRAFVTPDDVKRMAHAVLAHRVIVKPEAELSGITSTDIVDQALSSVPVPHSLAE